MENINTVHKIISLLQVMDHVNFIRIYPVVLPHIEKIYLCKYKKFLILSLMNAACFGPHGPSSCIKNTEF
jgi:hypothetical protein